MQWSRPAWPITWEILAFVLVAAGLALRGLVWLALGW